jgi:peptidoglycan/xylan/chitin deacetylase (PgdA/CDA1 family)
MVGVHCYRHRNLMRLTPGQVREDLRRAADAIESAAASVPELYRPPYGILTTPALAHAKRQTWQSVLWRKDGHDWKERATPQSISARILDGLRAGDIVLLHDSDAYSAADSWRSTVRALPQVIDAIRRRGLAFVPLA